MDEKSHIKQRPHSVRGQIVMQDMLIPSLDMIANAIRRVPARESWSLVKVRQDLAVAAGAEATCPVTTQHHVSEIAARAVAAYEAGETDVVPFWRVIDPAKPSAKRLAGGLAFQLARRNEERS